MRLADTLLALCLATGTLACGDRGAAPPAGSGAAAGGSAAPVARLCPVSSELERALAPFDGRRGPSIDQDLPEGEGAPLGDGVVLTLSGGEILLDGQRVQGTALGDALSQRTLLPAIVVAVAPSEKALEPLRAVVEAAGDRPVFLAARPPGAPRFALPRSVREEVAKDPMGKPRHLAIAISRSIEQCPPAKAVFSELAALDPTRRNAALREKLPVAIDACGCKVEPDFVELLVYVSSGGGPLVGKRVRVAADGKAISLGALDAAGLFAALPADGAISFAP